MALTPSQIMLLWEREHQPLTQKQREMFLERPEVVELGRLRADIVSKGLWTVVTEVRDCPADVIVHGLSD